MDWFLKDDPDMLWRCIDIVNRSVPIVDILRGWGIGLQKSSGKFEWKAKCPLPSHVGKGTGGQERTPSFCVSSDNRFYCFGCSGFGGPADLVSSVQGIPMTEAIRALAVRAGILDGDGNWNEDVLASVPEKARHRCDPEQTVEPHILRASAALRDHVRSFAGTCSFDGEFGWAELMGEKMDELIDHIGHEDWEYAKNMCDKVLESIRRRKERLA